MQSSKKKSSKHISWQSFEEGVDWSYFVDALSKGHKCPRAQVKDIFLGSLGKSLLNRAAYIEGIGFGVKSVTIFADNARRGLPTVQGAMFVFAESNGILRATIDSDLVTDLKTAADSVLGAKYLARKESKTLLVIGAGKVAMNVISAYSQMFPELKSILIWNRTFEKADQLASSTVVRGLTVQSVQDLQKAVAEADIVSTATMSNEPVLFGNWVKSGTHVDLIGSYRAEMREADDQLLLKSRLFVDSRDTTMQHIGELKIPIDSGVITEEDILADLYQLTAGFKGRNSPEDITVFKNGGGAHLDLMVADAILKLKSF